MNPEGDIWIHRYVMRSLAALNSASTRLEFPGALLRVGAGYAALHPWTEFGDAPLEDQLDALRSGFMTPLLERTLHIARVDGSAREQGRSLFDGLAVPPSHYSWSFGQPTQGQLDYMRESGFTALKVKGFSNYGETTRFLDATARIWPEVALRVDFNGCLDPLSFRRFVEYMPLRVYRQLDFIEDPVPYDFDIWEPVREKWRVRLALDKGWQRGDGGFDAVVVKPARRDWRVVAARHPGLPLVLTSAMDHPLGQAWAAYEAALAWQDLSERILLCGLVTQHLFVMDEFSAMLKVQGGVLCLQDRGTGLGFDDLVTKLAWERL